VRGKRNGAPGREKKFWRERKGRGGSTGSSGEGEESEESRGGGVKVRFTSRWSQVIRTRLLFL